VGSNVDLVVEGLHFERTPEGVWFFDTGHMPVRVSSMEQVLLEEILRLREDAI
jgi:hypothetical protein